MRFQEKTAGFFLTAILMVSWSQRAAADSDRVVNSTLDALASTAAIVEGRVASHSLTYDRAAGPRTIATLDDVRSQFGRYDDRTLQLAMLGGRVSESRWLFIPELPRLTDDTRYLIFLTSSAWFYSPVVADYIFRLEPGPRGSDVLITPEGHAVVGLSAEGLEISPDPVVETRFDFLTPYAKPRLLDSDPSLLASAMSKEAFLAALQDLMRTVPLRGEFLTSPASDRVWNQIPAAEDR
ncbi:MAG TPA: hypothetical protein VKM72_19235 [Thermoanaerobaculia bacterium]|nr:hypothetical protein [Thermoanaerobaculia bacterium]